MGLENGEREEGNGFLEVRRERERGDCRGGALPFFFSFLIYIFFFKKKQFF